MSSSWVSLIMHPMLTLDLWADEETESTGIDWFWLLAVFYAVGIWLVVERYNKTRNSAVPFTWAEPPQAEVDFQSKFISRPTLLSHLDDTELMPPIALDREYMTSYDPATGQHIATMLADNPKDIEIKLERAHKAQPEWRRTTFAQRRRVVRTLQKWLVDNQEACARVACRDTGKTMIDAALGEILTTCSKMEWLVDHGEKALRPEARSTNWAMLYKKAEVHYDPLGVVAAIVSWNYPLHNAWSPILAGLFSGNAVVLKCSENVIWSSNWFIGAIQEALEACGHSKDLVSVVCCYPKDAACVIESPLIKHITFIGSEEVGRIVAVAATKNLTPVTLELGGKDPAIIMPDTDLYKWASIWMRGTFQNAGQNCIGIERLIVHESQHDELYDILLDRVLEMRLGSVMHPDSNVEGVSLDCGAMITGERLGALETIIRQACDEGAEVDEGLGLTYEHPDHPDGAYFQPTLIGNVHTKMDISKHELFAPVALLMPYKTVEHAISIANGTRYGLGASVFGPDQRDCIEVAKQLECGMVSVNDFGVFYLNQDLPFGGAKASGYGRFGGPEGLRALTNPKAIMVDRWPWLVQTSIPKVLDYPVKDMNVGWDFTAGLVRLLYSDGWRARIRGLFALLGASRK